MLTRLTRLTQFSLLAAILLSAGCAHHHHDRDGWRDRDQRRWHDDDRRRYDDRHDYRRDDRRYRDDD